MPLARIFTRNPERTTDLSSQLQQQGYTVEVVSPDQAHLAPADLEIEFEVCERTDVLARAADLATELEADVAVAPGVLQPSVVQPTVLQPGISRSGALQPETLKNQPSPTAPVNAQSMAGHTEELTAEASEQRDPEREFEAAFAPVIEMPAAVIDIPVMEQEPLPPVAFLDEPAAFSEPSRAADPMPYLAQLTPFSAPGTRAQQTQASDLHNNKSGNDDPRNNVLESGAKIAARTWADALALTSSTAASVRDHFQEYKKRAQVRSAEARAAHAARLLDLEQRRADAQQRAAELEAARELAAARLMELVRQREPGLHEPSQSEQSLHEERLSDRSMDARSTLWEDSREAPRENSRNREREMAPVVSSVPAPAAMRQGRADVPPVPVHLWQRINPPLRAILTGAVAVSALFIMGIALGLFHSRTPLASPANHASNGEATQSGGVTVQTGGVTVQTGGVTVQTGSAKPQPPAGVQTASKPTPLKPAQPGATTQAQANPQTPAKPSPRIQQAQHLVAQQFENAIGDDVVIRHFSRPVPTQKPKQAGQQAGLKHFSDLEN
ncbi:MAG: hypothetical protein LAO78_17885 [Acidobacteriia bacterium]|nr:hypothetical protein [Terriglobia bacterium]